MTRSLVYGLGGLHLGTALWIWAWPLDWYATVPGVQDTGPANLHFMRDIALIYLVSGAGLIAAMRHRDRRLGLWAASWPGLHALFHLWIWAAHRGAALDLVALTNLVGIQAPAWAGLALVMSVDA